MDDYDIDDVVKECESLRKPWSKLERMVFLLFRLRDRKYKLSPTKEDIYSTLAKMDDFAVDDNHVYAELTSLPCDLHKNINRQVTKHSYMLNKH